jgi:hypothetical protein
VVGMGAEPKRGKEKTKPSRTQSTAKSSSPATSRSLVRDSEQPSIDRYNTGSGTDIETVTYADVCCADFFNAINDLFDNGSVWLGMEASEGQWRG